jgi:microcystin-dependent protein
MFAGNFAPTGWMFCEGQLLAISENDTLFQLIGTTYGGDGQNTFALPDLRGRLPVHMGTGGGSTYVLAQQGGVESVTLNTTQLPAHNHAFLATASVANSASAAGNVIAQTSSGSAHLNAGATVVMAAGSLGAVGGNQPHSNLQPYLCVSFIISLFGIYPSP